MAVDLSSGLLYNVCGSVVKGGMLPMANNQRESHLLEIYDRLLNIYQLAHDNYFICIPVENADESN